MSQVFTAARTYDENRLRNTDRRFTISDAMILVLSMAAGLALARWYLVITPDFLGVVDSIRAVVHFLLLTGCFGVILLRLRRPRPNARRLFRQPGFVACVSVALSSIVHTVNSAINELSQYGIAGWTSRETRIVILNS